MIVASDASPINYLVLIGAEHVLQLLFGEIVIPPAVERELTHRNTPAVVKTWMAQPPQWLRVQAPSTVRADLDLDAGEVEAISLSLELHAEALLIDDRKGSLAATRQGLNTVGTITVLEFAARKGLLSLDDAFARLLKTNFRVAPRLIVEAVERSRSHPA